MGDKQNYLVLSESIVWVSQGVGQFKNIVVLFLNTKWVLEIEYETKEKAEEIIEKLLKQISIEPPIIIS